jgi:DNA repair exonuclease SbcCD ATPase subunit
MKTQRNCRHGFSKPLLLITLAAIVGFGLLAMSQKQVGKLSKEVAGLKSRVAELESSQLEPKALLRFQSQGAEIERLKKDAQELPKLRGEITRLRTRKAEFDKMEEEIEPLKAAVRELASIKKQNNQLANREQYLTQLNRQIQGQMAQGQQAVGGKAVFAQYKQCVINLKQLDGAAQQWALETKKIARSPVEVEGIKPYLRGSRLPLCPIGGHYSFRTVSESPTCAVHGGL